ncbi:hypothetical protein C8Q77DRAFT_703064 [Trametes polyzona]|nr:hypothetical protein C8Q77DRAFT_703064 [Trametes polyzona]
MSTNLKRNPIGRCHPPEEKSRWIPPGRQDEQGAAGPPMRPAQHSRIPESQNAHLPPDHCPRSCICDDRLPYCMTTYKQALYTPRSLASRFAPRCAHVGVSRSRRTAARGSGTEKRRRLGARAHGIGRCYGSSSESIPQARAGRGGRAGRRPRSSGGCCSVLYMFLRLAARGYTTCSRRITPAEDRSNGRGSTATPPSAIKSQGGPCVVCFPRRIYRPRFSAAHHSQGDY